MKKTSLLMVALLLLAALAGCNNSSTPAGGNGGGAGAQGAAQPQLTAWQSVDELDSLEWLTVGEGENALQIPQFTGAAENAVFAKFNSSIQAAVGGWLAELGEGNTLELTPYVLETENYISVVLYKEVVPNYGTDGEVYSWVYDKIVDNAMDSDYALAWVTLSEDMISEAIAAQMQEGERWISFSTEAFYIDGDEKPVFLLPTLVRTSGADDWTTIFVLKNGEILGKWNQLTDKN